MMPQLVFFGSVLVDLLHWSLVVKRNPGLPHKFDKKAFLPALYNFNGFRLLLLAQSHRQAEGEYEG